jgi:hypothetical protein
MERAAEPVRRLLLGLARYLSAPATLTIACVVVVCFVMQRLTYDSAHAIVCQCGRGVTTMHTSAMQDALAFSTSRIARGQWWRVVTPNLVNGPVPMHIFGRYYDLDLGQPGLGHLVANLFGLLYIGPFLERRFGWRWFVALAIVTGAVAYGWLMALPNGWNLVDGTSGTVFGLYGVAVAVLVLDRPTTRWGWAFAAGLAAFVAGGFLGQPYITVHIHAGGFFSGLVLGLVILRTDRRRVHKVATPVGGHD